MLIASPGRPMLKLVREQVANAMMNPADKAVALQLLDANGDGVMVDVSAARPSIRAVFSQRRQRYLIEISQHDPLALIAAVTRPVLVVQGLRDLQISPSDADALHKANPGSEIELLPDVNHQLRVTKTESRLANIATYVGSGTGLSPRLVGSVAGFISENSRLEE